MTWLDLASKKAAITKLTSAKRLNGSTSCAEKKQTKKQSPCPLFSPSLPHLTVLRCHGVKDVSAVSTPSTTGNSDKGFRGNEKKNEVTGAACLMKERGEVLRERHDTSVCMCARARMYDACVRERQTKDEISSHYNMSSFNTRGTH